MEEQVKYGTENIVPTFTSELLDNIEPIVLINPIGIRYSTMQKCYEVYCGNVSGYAKSIERAFNNFLKLYKAVSNGETKELVAEEVKQ